MIEILFIFPIAASIILYIFKSRMLNVITTFLYSVIYLAISVMLYIQPLQFTQYFKVDSLNILFMLLLAVLYFGVSIYNIDYIRHKDATKGGHTLYTIYLLFFIFSMTGVILSSHLALLWVFVEATTLTSSYLIYFNKSDSSLEATWKYLFICSIGISLAFVGIILLSMGLGSVDSLFFNDLYKNAAKINPFWLKLAYPFILVGFGTKIGFAPVHAWLPDAHSESPSPISALLSGALLNVGLLGILRVNKLMEIANMAFYVKTLLIIMGFLSLFVSAVFILKIKNYKRMLAYSSIENMGIIAISLGLGGAGLFAAMLHLAAHSLTKASFFLTSGNILHRYGTKEISEVSGLLKKDKVTGWLWIFCFAGIVGLPPFPIFLSEFLIVKALFESGYIVLAVLFVLLLTIIMAGIGKAVLKMSFGNGDETVSSKAASFLVYVPQIIFLIILLLMGISLPDYFYDILQKAVLSL